MPLSIGKTPSSRKRVSASRSPTRRAARPPEAPPSHPKRRSAARSVARPPEALPVPASRASATRHGAARSARPEPSRNPGVSRLARPVRSAPRVDPLASTLAPRCGGRIGSPPAPGHRPPSPRPRALRAPSSRTPRPPTPRPCRATFPLPSSATSRAETSREGFVRCHGGGCRGRPRPRGCRAPRGRRGAGGASC